MKPTLLIPVIFWIMSYTSSRATLYYVNDGSNVGNVYTTNIGMIGNNGLTPATPQSSIQYILNTYVLTGGDTVYIDPGTYVEDLLLNGTDNGSAGSRISFTGADAATTIIQSSITYAIRMTTGSRYTQWSNLSITGTWAVFFNGDCDHHEFVNCIVTGNQYAFDVLGSGGNTPDYNLIHDCILSSTWVGIRLKSGASYNQVYDNFIRTSVPSGVMYSSVELQSTYNNLIYRNKVSSRGDCIEGTVHVGQLSSGNVFTNNYITNESAPGGTYRNPAIEFDDNSTTTFIHNSIYSVGPCVHLEPLTGVVNITNVSFTNNILYSTAYTCLDIPRADVAFQNCDNNLYYAPGASGNVVLEAGVNLTLAAWQASLPGGSNEANGIYVNPDYISPATGNLDLQSTSVAMDAVYIASVADDIYQTSRPMGPRSDIGAYEIPPPLPVNLLNFFMDCSKEQLLLSWVTITEKNNHFFTIESSMDGKSFEPVAMIKATGNSQEISYYKHTLESSAAKIVRLSQTDYDGRRSYLGILSNACGQEHAYHVYSSNNGIFLEVNNSNEEAEELEVMVHNVIGQQIAKMKLIIPPGHGLYEIGADLSSGVYVIEVLGRNKKVIVKAIKK